MASETVVYTPESQANNALPWMLAGQNNGSLFGNNGWGGGILGFLLGLFFGNGWGGFGNGFGGFGGGNGAGFLSNQLNNDSGRELLMNAITSNGEASRAAISNLATMLGQDYSQVSAAVSAIQNGLSSLALQQAVSVPHVINAIQSGDAAMQAKFAECCCAQKLLTVEQGYQSQIATLNQTNTLGSQADRNTNSIISAINAQTVAMNDQFCAAKERELQSKIDTQADIITQLRGQLDNDRQTAQLQAMLAPIASQVSILLAKAPNTIPVVWPQLTVTQTTPTTGA